MNLSPEDLHNTLKQKLGLETFRPGQEEIIRSVLAGKDVMAIMPTGGGKSLCYQLPAILRPGITVVISPLIALMNDQVEILRRQGLPAGGIHSGLSMDQRREIFSEMATADHYLLYLSPERIQKPGFAQWLQKQKLALFAIDEAHCVSQWGHDFRPEYAEISLLRRLRPEVPIVALTATATPQVKRDIRSHLALNSPDEHVYGFYRNNLYYQVEDCFDDEDKENFVQQAIRQHPTGRILLYCGTRKKAEAWSEFLGAQGNGQVNFYHAGLSTKQRKEIETKYREGGIRILAATNAFGMGIDHSDVRLVIHTQMPGNIESYYQEMGRAGRDGEDSTCLLLYAKKDKGLHSFFIRQSEAPQSVIQHRWQALDAIVQYAEGAECRHGDILTYFKDQKRLGNCGHCDSCAPESPRRIERPPRSELSETKKALKRSSRRKTKEAPAPLATMNFEARQRMESLRKWRKDYATENDIPAFIVFSDKTLRDLAVKAPTTEEGLHAVYGLGEKKIETFGQRLIEELGRPLPS